MTATLPDVAAKKQKQQDSAEQQAVAELVRQARQRGVSLTGPDGLLKQLTKTVLETALAEEMSEHLGYEKNEPADAGGGNVRNGARPKTVLTEASGPSRSRCLAIGPAHSPRRSSRSGSGACPASTRSCCRCMPRA